MTVINSADGLLVCDDSEAAAAPALVARAPRFDPWFVAAAIIVCATAIASRVHGLFDGIPYAVGIDEPAIIGRSLQMLKTGDWNPHFFDYPAVMFYVQALVGSLRYLFGVTVEGWTSRAQMDAASLYPAGRVVAAGLALLGVYWTYRAGCELESKWLGVVAAAQLAVFPQHVRESHFVLADVPSASFAMLALWLGLRAARTRTIRAYALAGAAAGLAAATKYNAAFVIVPIVVSWVALDRRWRNIGSPIAALVAMAAVFLLLNPYVVLDWQGFRQGFGALVVRFTGGSTPPAEPAWSTYLKHLNRAGTGWLPAVCCGALVGLATGRRRAAWLAIVVFGAGYFWILAAHPPVFARYTLPMLPALCLLAGLPVVRVADWLRQRGLPAVVPAGVLLFGLAWFTAVFGHQSADWLRQQERTDTREIAAAWLRAAGPRGAIIAIESFGPTNLDHAGFVVLETGRLVGRPISWYAAQGCHYVVVSAWNMPQYQEFVDQAPTVFHVTPAGRWGPDIRILDVSGKG